MTLSSTVVGEMKRNLTGITIPARYVPSTGEDAGWPNRREDYPMPTTTRKRAPWQRLNQDTGGTVYIEMREGESFGLPFDDVVRACRSQEKLQEFVQQLSDLTEYLDK